MSEPFCPTCAKKLKLKPELHSRRVKIAVSICAVIMTVAAFTVPADALPWLTLVMHGVWIWEPIP